MPETLEERIDRLERSYRLHRLIDAAAFTAMFIFGGAVIWATGGLQQRDRDFQAVITTIYERGDDNARAIGRLEAKMDHALEVLRTAPALQR
jgi:hypothetical protein